MIGTSYSQTLTATGSASSWSIASGSLPVGLTLSGNTISGIPTEAGTYMFTVMAENFGGSNKKTLSITINTVPTTTHSIISSAGLGGTINPSGSVSVSDETNQTFNINPAAGYRVANVIVDGMSIGATGIIHLIM